MQTTKQTILLIDDCDMMQRFLKPVFKDDFNVVTSSSGMEAILYLRNQPAPSLILLDFNLPEMSGLDVLKAIRESRVWNDVPVVMLSGIKDAEKRWQCLEAGANDFISKPFHPKELRLRVNLMLNKKTVKAL